jgi:hypothetical protein
MSEPYSVAVATEKLDEFQKSLEMLIPNPSNYRLLDLNREYTPQELRDLLQKYGSYVATLCSLEGRLEAESVLVDKGLKTGLAVAITQLDPKTTIAAREAEVLASSDTFRDLRKMQIYNEAYSALLKGWKDAYQQAYTTVSRLISLLLGEVEHLSLRSN